MPTGTPRSSPGPTAQKTITRIHSVDRGYGAEVSKQTISTITDRVMDGMAEWQNRPLDAVYAVLFIDAINVKIREGQVANRPVYLALGVTVDGSVTCSDCGPGSTATGKVVGTPTGSFRPVRAAA